MFVDRRYGRTVTMPVLTAAGAARIELRNKRRIRRKPSNAALVAVENILIAYAIYGEVPPRS